MGRWLKQTIYAEVKPEEFARKNCENLRKWSENGM